MWHSLQRICNVRKLSNIEVLKFAVENREKYKVIGKQFGDDVGGLGDDNELYVSTFYIDDFIKAFKSLNT